MKQNLTNTNNLAKNINTIDGQFASEKMICYRC